MSQEPLTVVAVMTARPGREEDLRRELRSLIEPTRRENGCLKYDLHESEEKPGQFVFLELWTGREALDVHLDNEHLRRFKELAPGLLDGPMQLILGRQIG